MSFDPLLISNIINIALIVVFIIFLIFGVLFAILSFSQGVFRTTSRLIVFSMFLVAGICVLEPIAGVVASMPLSFLPVKTIILNSPTSSVQYFAPVTTLSGTLTSAFKGYYLLYGIAGNSAVASQYALAMAGTVVKTVSFMLIMLVIMTFGFISEIILWHAVFKFIIPKLAQRRIKWRIFSTIEGITLYVVSTFMLLAPLSSIVNSANTAYQQHKNDSSNEIVQSVGNFLDTYNNSAFAKVFYNWTVNDEGLTADAQVMNLLTQATLGNTAVGISDSVHSLTEVASVFSNALTTDDEGNNVINASVIASSETIIELFGVLRESRLVSAIIPIAAEMALNKDLFAEKINGLDPQIIDISDIEWEKEMDNIETMVLDIVNSGIVSNFIDENGFLIEGSDISPAEMISSCLTNNAFAKVGHALKTIDDSKLLKRAITAVIAWFASSNEDYGKFFSNSWDELNDISWGFELSTLLECLHDMYLINPDIVSAIFSMNDEPGTDPEPAPLPSRAPDGNGNPIDNIVSIIMKDIDAYQNIVIGETDGNNSLVNVDSSGRTVVYENGKKVSGRKYCLFDLFISRQLITPLVDKLGEISETASEKLPAVLNELSSGSWMLKYKNEFASIFHTLSAFKDNPDAISSLLSGNISIIPESGKLEDIDPVLIKCFSKTLPRMDKSLILSAAIFPTFEEMFEQEEIKDNLEKVNIDPKVVKAGFAQAIETRTLGYEMAKFVRVIPKLPSIIDAVSGTSGSTAETIEKIGENSENISYCLDALYSCKILNPSKDSMITYEGESYKVNYSYFNVLSYIFGDALSIEGLTFKEDEMSPSTIWENNKNEDGEFYRDRHNNPIYTGENGAIAYVLEVIADSHIMDILDDPTFFSDNAKLGLLAREDKYNLPGILKAVNNSQLFSKTMGDFLDVTLADLQVTGIADVTFNNVVDWEDEGIKLGRVLEEVGKAEVNLSSLSFTEVKDIVGLNNMLHALVDSNIFINKANGDFLFGKWLFIKFTDSTNGLEDVFGGYSLVTDPDHTYWNSDWENYENYELPSLEYDNYRILYNDLRALNSKNDWYDDSFEPNFNTNDYVGTEFEKYYDNDNFYTAYVSTLRLDELGHLTELIYWSQKALAVGEDIINISSNVFDNLLDSINRTRCLRIGVYNIFEIAKKSIRDNETARDYFDLSPAYNTYLINCDRGMSLFEESYIDRQTEINYLEDVVKTYRMMTAKGILNQATGVFSTDMIDAEFSEQMKKAIKGLNDSLVFHRKGSFLRDPNDEETYYPTAFQNMIASFFLKSDLKDIIYCDANPKDVYQSSIAGLYEPNVSSKVDYINQTYFDWKVTGDDTYLSKQKAEIDRVFEAVNAVVGGPKSNGTGNYVGLKRFDTDLQKWVTTFSFTDFDIGLSSNITAIKEILTALNNTETLFDAVPNSVYICLTTSSIVSQFGGLNKVHFEDTNLFYHYFDKTNTQGAALYNWNAKFTDSNDITTSDEKSDITLITNLLKQASYYASDTPAEHNKSIITAFENFDTLNDSSIDSLETFMTSMVNSKVFHSAGPSKTIDTATGDIIPVNTVGKTVFQEMIEQFLSAEHIARNLYNEHSPKDYGITVDEKISNIATSVFSFETSKILAEEDEISYLCDFLRSALNDFKTTNIMKFDFNQSKISGDAVNNLLTTLNNSQCLYDSVPNLIYETLNSSNFGLFGSAIDLKTGEPFYIYTKDSTEPAYETRYPQSEIDNFGFMIDSYKEFNRIVDEENITDLHVIKSLTNDGYLYDLLSSLHDSEMLHVYNSRNAVDGKLTVFEQAMFYIADESGISVYTYGAANSEARLIANLENVTMLEKENLPNDVGYHNKWNVPGGFDELHAFIDFVKAGQEFYGETGSLDFSTMSFGEKDPQSVGKLMKALNKVDFLSDALPVFIKTGFHEIGLDTLTTYDGVDYAYYDLGQYVYGGRNLDGGVFEIDYIVDALSNLYVKYEHISSLHYANLNNIVDFAKNTTDFNGVMELLQLGHIFNTSLDGEYDVMNTVEGQNISTRGLMLYGILSSNTSDPGAGAHLAEYLVGDNKIEKVAGLSKIFTFGDDYDYLKESIGLYTICKYSTFIDQTVLDLNHFENFASTKDVIASLLDGCYNVNGYGRSYFASEIMAGLLNQVVAKETPIGDPLPITYGPSCIGTDVSNINTSAFNNLNKVEGASVNGILEVYSMISKAGTSQAPTFVAFINQMGKLDNGGVFAKVVWKGEIADTIGLAADPFDPAFTFDSIAGTVATLLGLN